MKIGRKALLVLGVVVIVAAIVVVGMFYFRQAGERSVLNDRGDAAEARRAVLNASKQDLNDQLTSAQSSLDELSWSKPPPKSAQFPESVESIEYGEYLFEIARICDVRLDPLVFPKPAAATAGGVAYSVVSLILPVSGTQENVFKFIEVIRTDYWFASTKIKSINMNTGGSATINVDIYGYKG